MRKKIPFFKSSIAGPSFLFCVKHHFVLIVSGSRMHSTKLVWFPHHDKDTGNPYENTLAALAPACCRLNVFEMIDVWRKNGEQ